MTDEWWCENSHLRTTLSVRQQLHDLFYETVNVTIYFNYVNLTIYLN